MSDYNNNRGIVSIIFIIFDYVLYTLARQSSNKFGFALDLFVYLTSSYILSLGKAQINLALLSTYSYICTKYLSMADRFYTIAARSEAVFKEKMSKFLSFAVPVVTRDEAKSVIVEIAKKYHDARHVCWAFMLGADRLDFLSSDNGEPSGTAGKPILGQINSFGLTNVVIVVVRYFGGIKLGTSGLIAAYREAARLALDKAEIVEDFETVDMTVGFSYIAMNDIMKVLKNSQAEVVSQDFDNSCTIVIRIRSGEADAIGGRLSAAGATVTAL